MLRLWDQVWGLDQHAFGVQTDKPRTPLPKEDPLNNGRRPLSYHWVSLNNSALIPSSLALEPRVKMLLHAQLVHKTVVTV